MPFPQSGQSPSLSLAPNPESCSDFSPTWKRTWECQGDLRVHTALVSVYAPWELYTGKVFTQLCSKQ